MNPEYCLNGNLPSITKDMFPIGKKVLLASFIDGACGWEFDAPLHIISPFHLYYEVGSNTEETVSERVIGMLYDLEFGDKKQDLSTWPYTKNYFKGIRRRILNGNLRNGICLYKTTVTVHEWPSDDTEGKIDVETVEFSQESRHAQR